MTANYSFDKEITDTQDLEGVLGAMLYAALQQDVDPRGSWVYRSEDGAPDLEVMVTELESPETTD